MKRRTLPNPWCCAAALAAMLSLCGLPDSQAEEQTPPPQGVSRGENFSAKPPAQLFASDCTGAGCHKGPQGLGKGSVGIGGLAGFLREHYTNSRESAAALAAYLQKLPSGPEPKEARKPKDGKPTTASAPVSGPASWFEGTSDGRPTPNEARKPRETPAGKPSRTASRPEPSAKPEPAAKPDAAVKPDGLIKPEEEPATVAHQHPAAEPGEPASEKPNEISAKPAETTAKPAEAAAKPAEPPSRPNARKERGRHPAAAASAAAVATPAPPAAAEPEPAPPPPPKQYDIFD